MVVMFSLNQAPLLSIQLLFMCKVFAGILQVDRRNALVFRGQSVMFTCNTSVGDITQIRWTRGSSVFVHSATHNLNFSDFTSHRLKIDLDLPSKLTVFNAQPDDAGLYTCTVDGRKDSMTTEWDLTVFEPPEDVNSSGYFPYILTSVIGLLLCAITSAVCLCRKPRASRPNQNPVQDQFHPESGEEVVLPQAQAGTERRTNNKQRSQYMERLNSIYSVY